MVWSFCLINHFHARTLDDDNRLVLEPISYPECQHDYINASYIDVSFNHSMNIPMHCDNNDED